MKVLIYGLGKEALIARNSIRKEHAVIGFVDSFANIKSYAGLNFYSRKSLNKICFDYIVLALSNRNAVETVRNELVEEGIKAEKIIDFMYLFARQKVDKVMDDERIDGLIFGNSHALNGINPFYLPGKWKNLSVSSEDLFYHYKTLKKCMDAYSDEIADLKYAIIDLYDYTFFNYDVSLSKQILFYWSIGGYAEDPHHYNKNKNYTGGIEEEMRNAGFYLPVFTKENLKLAEQLFDINKVKKDMEFLYFRNNAFRDYPLQSQLDKIILEIPDLPYNLYYNDVKYPETIEENVFIINEMIKLLKHINSKIKIFFSLIPRYGKMEKYHALLLSREKKEFESIMDKVLKEDNCHFFDFKKSAEIYSNRHFYTDVAHLNYIGGIAFTGLISTWIKEEI